ncbi:heavy-metal-associated domain-containing protein [Clostridium sp. SM-530-WT-3G]|uniref:heavy-metal-associated domain-containing protein n=1 Tax=Clostridium sp. SM-530-WT-3G TaxID=2725303 RepID=UPI00145E0D46|nr:heavy-metal-associated domain-containing protein [Clostridium sp. SM-530-WT-3G]NME83961.1 heavy-metal-associated domain-containing protein [Clostridium sp. SM-530-WT-3G]
MKSVIKIINMKSQRDASAIQDAVINSEGIIAIQTSIKKNEITVIYNDMYISLEKIIDIIEDLGYITI